MGTENNGVNPGQDEARGIEGEFYTEHFVIHGRVSTPETRLSDHLNGSTATFELTPTQVQRSVSGLRVNVAGSHAYIAKSHLLFVIPLLEPDRSSTDNSAWARTITHTCWAGFGRYSLVGKIHMEAGRDPRLFLRSLEERRFLPITDVRLTFPDGATRECLTVILNRLHVELLALQPDSMGADARLEAPSAVALPAQAVAM